MLKAKPTGSKPFTSWATPNRSDQSASRVHRVQQPQALLRGETQHGSVTKQIQLQITEDSKQLFLNGKREALARYLGNLAVFVFSLEEMDVIRGDPGQRRRFIDRGAVTSSPRFLNTLSRYNQVINRRTLARRGEPER
jgi:DNA replication and repair protein RecF